jgi:hypothetical protein
VKVNKKYIAAASRRHKLIYATEDLEAINMPQVANPTTAATTSQ